MGIFGNPSTPTGDEYRPGKTWTAKPIGQFAFKAYGHHPSSDKDAVYAFIDPRNSSLHFVAQVRLSFHDGTVEEEVPISFSCGGQSLGVAKTDEFGLATLEYHGPSPPGTHSWDTQIIARIRGYAHEAKCRLQSSYFCRAISVNHKWNKSERRTCRKIAMDGSDYGEHAWERFADLSVDVFAVMAYVPGICFTELRAMVSFISENKLIIVGEGSFEKMHKGDVGYGLDVVYRSTLSVARGFYYDAMACRRPGTFDIKNLASSGYLSGIVGAVDEAGNVRSGLNVAIVGWPQSSIGRVKHFSVHDSEGRHR